MSAIPLCLSSDTPRSDQGAVNAPHLLTLPRAGAIFINGKLIERPGEDARPEAA